jgi:hypothetical protein
MNEDLLLRITGFFDFWRNRALFIRNLDHQTNNYEANILIWSCLDALSNLWEKEIGKNKCKSFDQTKCLIFSEFLSNHYGNLFKQVSLPDIWDRLDFSKEEKPRLKVDGFLLTQEIIELLTNINRNRDNNTWERRNRKISDDLHINIVLNHFTDKCNVSELTKIKKWLMFSCYGAIAYKEMRNSYIHEGRGGKGAHGVKLHESEIRPTYLSHIYETPPKMGFSVEFMLEVLSKCIASFEKEAIELQQDPAPNKDTKKSKE